MTAIERVTQRVNNLTSDIEDIPESVVNELALQVIDRIGIKLNLNGLEYPNNEASLLDSIAVDATVQLVRRWEGGYEGKTSENADGAVSVGLVTDVLDMYDDDIETWIDSQDKRRGTVRFYGKWCTHKEGELRRG